jgi:hypothetical protein
LEQRQAHGQNQLNLFNGARYSSDGYAQLLFLYNESEEDLPTCSLCGLCDSPHPPFIEVKWLDGSDDIADFTDALGTVVVKTTVADELLKHFRGFSKGEVRMPEPPNLRRPKAGKLPKRVWLPYQGAELCFIRIAHETPLHPRSTVVVEKQCNTCGRISYAKIIGVAQMKGDELIPRIPGHGMFVERRFLAENDIFCPKFMGWTLCTGVVKEYVESRGFSNVNFLEVGELIE